MDIKGHERVLNDTKTKLVVHGQWMKDHMYMVQRTLNCTRVTCKIVEGRDIR